EAVADPCALLGLRVDDHDVAHMDRRLDGLDAAGARATGRAAGLDVTGHALHALDDDAVGVLEDLEDAPFLPAVAAGYDDDEVALLDLGHAQITSGAS